jgi:putative transposase
MVDEYTRRCVKFDVFRSICSEDVIIRFGELIPMYGVSKHIRSDSGPEFSTKAIEACVAQIPAGTSYVEASSPWESGCVGILLIRLRGEWMNIAAFKSFQHSRTCAATRREDYNDCRSHNLLGGLTPTEFTHRCTDSVSAYSSLYRHSKPLLITQS